MKIPSKKKKKDQKTIITIVNIITITIHNESKAQMMTSTLEEVETLPLT